MKNIFTVLFLFCFWQASVLAQITVDQGDFANAGDTARLSVAVWNPLLDFGATGANHTWDFSTLQWQSQFVDTFLSTLFINPIYGFTFSNTTINPYRSNIAKKADNTLTTLPLLSSVFTDGYNFYYKSTASYRQRGIGMKVGGFPTAVPMTHSDTLYRFPMNFGNEDSSWSDYKVNVPQLGVYVHKQHRVNKIDGWGTLITPFGTFDVLRVRTEIRGSDSIYIDTLNGGFKLDNDIQREYKWFGKNEKEPLLQINTQAGIFGQFQGFEFVTKIIYRDSARFEPVGIFDVKKDEIQFQVFPNPSNGFFFISVFNDLNGVSIKLTDVSGRLVLQRDITAPIEMINTSDLAKGIYILTLQSNEGAASKKLVVE
jgi:hypothetical protein